MTRNKETRKLRTTSAQLLHVPLGELTGDNIRKPSKDGLEELTRSVRQSGVLVPVLVAPFNGGYQLLDGFRRVHAARAAGLREVPARVVISEDHGGGIDVQLLANLQREDMSAVEAASAIRALMDRTGWTQAKVAEILGRSAQAVSANLKLLELTPKVLEQVQAGRISESHAEIIARAPTAIQRNLANGVMGGEWSVRRLEQEAKWKADRFREAHAARAAFVAELNASKFPCCPVVVGEIEEGGKKIPKQCGRRASRHEEWRGAEWVNCGRMGHSWSLKTGKVYAAKPSRDETEEPRAEAPTPELPEVTPELSFAASPADIADLLSASSAKVVGVLVGRVGKRNDVIVRFELPRELVPNVPWFSLGDPIGTANPDLLHSVEISPDGRAFMGGCEAWEQQTDATRKNLAKTKAALESWGTKVAGSPRGKKE